MCSNLYVSIHLKRGLLLYRHRLSCARLPENLLSETDLGKFKCEYLVKKGFFLAAKSYNIQTQDGVSITKHKGISKSLVDQEWFENQYEDIERTKEGHVTSPFSIDWDKWEIVEKTTNVKLGVHLGNKRCPVFKNNKWIDTEPIHVINIDETETKLRVEVIKLKEQNAEKDRVIERLQSQFETGVKEDVQEEVQADGLMSSKAYSESNRVIERLKEREEMLKQLRKYEGKK